MTVVEIIDKIVAWAKVEICEKVKLKVPPDDDEESNSAGYQYTLANPACFPLFVPSKEKLPPSIPSPFPSVCVRILEGEDNLTSSTGNITIELALSTWSTGTHGNDIFYPDEENKGYIKRWTGAEADAYFDRAYEGWRDIWNFVDTVIRAVESTLTIDGIEIDRSVGVKFYPFKEQEAIPDFYPFWFAGVQFSVKRPIVRNIREFEDLL